MSLSHRGRHSFDRSFQKVRLCEGENLCKRMEAKLLERQPELGKWTLCAKGTVTRRISGNCIAMLYRGVILGNQQPQDSGQMVNVAYLPKTQKAMFQFG